MFGIAEEMFDKSFIVAYREAIFGASRNNSKAPWLQEVVFFLLALKRIKLKLP
jgi:hypothetical protein